MDTSKLRSDVLLLLSAVIWGFAFVAQRLGMAHVGPFTFTATRFTLGTAALLPFALCSQRRHFFVSAIFPGTSKTYAWGGALAGVALFGGVSFQQAGLVFTGAGNAGFITGLYVVVVPILGLMWGQRTTLGSWLGAALAAVGLYFLSVTQEFNMNRGDLLVLAGAVIWALHVHILGRMAPVCDPLMLASVQFSICTLLSWVVALAFESVAWHAIVQAAGPILYGGLMSVGVAYTLQVVGQRHAHPAHAAILLSLEAVFAALGGWLLLGETLTLRALTGCALMLAGMLLSQFFGFIKMSAASVKA